MAHQNTIETIQFDGGALCLDFINTVRNRKVPVMHNYLATYQSFIIWCRRINAWPEELLHTLWAYSQAHPEKAELALQSILATRENMYALFSAIAAESTPDSTELKNFNHYLSNALTQAMLNFDNHSLKVEINIWENDLEGPVKTVLYSAFQTLTQANPKKIKECAECGWLFLDTTKNGKRQWCNPGYCGSTSKARRYYHRKKEKEQN
ncbi:hypothetical protein AHMF7605_05970 [Adhaeribacter arboris]|uniref:Zinc finger CGNR domain-containing protein n=1 Tax=Adhaeribacter arboris TaxID=2072846 RepID=A0A2T2YC57_9BACT|nr:CGNR zinc finger domain-containing protein [Adhaeribacter arboris]PSR53105.1 hypothetical protein AHMF7605_05970 [Adhaeribacter arboris]